MLVSVIVPVYGQLPRVLKLCTSILAHPQKKVKQILLVDDCSTEFNLPELVGHPFSVVRSSLNQGFVKTENSGAKMTDGELLLFLNSDTEVHADWIDPAVKLMEENSAIGVVGLKLVFPPNEKGEVTIQSCGGLYDIGRMPYHRYLGWLANDPRVNKAGKVSWVTGGALLTRRDVFDKVGGFDEEYTRGYFEDCDYCESVRQLGYDIFYCAESSATHYVGQSMGALKTPEEQHKAARSFYNNARRFESKWSAKITPDVQFQMVNY